MIVPSSGKQSLITLMDWKCVSDGSLFDLFILGLRCRHFNGAKQKVPVPFSLNEMVSVRFLQAGFSVQADLILMTIACWIVMCYEEFWNDDFKKKKKKGLVLSALMEVNKKKKKTRMILW